MAESRFIVKEKNLESTEKLTRKEREFQSRRNEILDAALKLFATKGYYNTSMQEIATESEFSIGTLYNFFKNKEELFFTLVGERSEGIFANILADVQSATDPLDKISALVESLLKHFETEKKFFKIFLGIRTNFEWELKDDLGEKLHNAYLKYIEFLTMVIRDAQRAGKIKDVDSSLLAHTLLGIINSNIFQWFTSDADYSLVAKKDLILDLFFHGAVRSGA